MLLILLDVLDGLESLVQLVKGILIGLGFLLLLAGIRLLFPLGKPVGHEKQHWSSRLWRWVGAGVLMLPAFWWLTHTMASNLEKNQNAKAAQQAKVAFRNSFVGTYRLNPATSDSAIRGYRFDLILRADSSYQLTSNMLRETAEKSWAVEPGAIPSSSSMGAWHLYNFQSTNRIVLVDSRPDVSFVNLRYFDEDHTQAQPYLLGTIPNNRWKDEEHRWLRFGLQKQVAPTK